jgi:hypothetical protein
VREIRKDGTFEALLARRDHLRIQINLMENGDSSSGETPESARRELAELEQRIIVHKRAPDA